MLVFLVASFFLWSNYTWLMYLFSFVLCITVFTTTNAYSKKKIVWFQSRSHAYHDLASYERRALGFE